MENSKVALNFPEAIFAIIVQLANNKGSFSNWWHGDEAQDTFSMHEAN